MKVHIILELIEQASLAAATSCSATPHHAIKEALRRTLPQEEWQPYGHYLYDLWIRLYRLNSLHPVMITHGIRIRNNVFPTKQDYLHHSDCWRYAGLYFLTDEIPEFG